MPSQRAYVTTGLRKCIYLSHTGQGNLMYTPGQYILLKFYLFEQRKTFPTFITLISKASGLIEIKIAESLAAAARVWLLSGVFQIFTNQPWATYSRPSSPWAARPYTQLTVDQKYLGEKMPCFC